MSAVHASRKPASVYQERARALAAHARDAWEHSSRSDLKSLVDDVQCALIEEANHELRQVLFQLSAQLELALFRMSSSRTTLEVSHIERLLAATARATAVVDAYLDRGEAAKLVIPLSRSRFDLGEALSDLVRWHGFHDAEVHLEPVEVEADRERLVGVLGHMMARLQHRRTGADRLRVVLGRVGDRVEGFIGITGSRLHATDLLAEFDRPFRVEDMAMDMPYSRAVIERHGGTLFVSTDSHGADGYSFILPSQAAQEP